jgi:hypothetical protein
VKLAGLGPGWQARIGVFKRLGDAIASALCYTEGYD